MCAGRSTMLSKQDHAPRRKNVSANVAERPGYDLVTKRPQPENQSRTRPGGVTVAHKPPDQAREKRPHPYASAAEPCVQEPRSRRLLSFRPVLLGPVDQPSRSCSSARFNGLSLRPDRGRLPAAIERAPSARRGARLQTCRVAIPGDMSFHCNRPQPLPPAESGDGPGAGNKTSRSQRLVPPQPQYCRLRDSELRTFEPRAICAGRSTMPETRPRAKQQKTVRGLLSKQYCPNPQPPVPPF